MLFAFQKIAEQRIEKAMRDGEFKDLEGAGKPLDLAGPDIPEELKIAYKMLKNGGFVPPEIELKKEIRRTEELLAAMGETEEKYRAMKRLNHLILKLNMARGGRVDFEMPEKYEGRLVERFSRTKDPKSL